MEYKFNITLNKNTIPQVRLELTTPALLGYCPISTVR